MKWLWKSAADFNINIKKIVKRNDPVFLEIGANVGRDTKRFLDKFKEDKTASLFSEVTLSTLDRQTTGAYLFVIFLKPKENV